MSVQYHIELGPGDPGRYVFLPGDPGRVERIAQALDDPRPFAQHREYCTWVGELEGERVSVVSTGIGGPSAAIAVQELARVGATTFIRLGTCGLLQPAPMAPGDLIVPTGSVRGGATALAYVPESYPAVADPQVHQAMMAAAADLGLRHHSGIIQCKDAFYLEEGDCLPDSAGANARWETWRRANVLATEMESDTLFVLGTIYGLRAGSLLLGLGGKFDPNDSTAMTAAAKRVDDLIRCGVEGMRRLVIADKQAAQAGTPASTLIPPNPPLKP